MRSPRLILILIGIVLLGIVLLSPMLPLISPSLSLLRRLRNLIVNNKLSKKKSIRKVRKAPKKNIKRIQMIQRIMLKVQKRTKNIENIGNPTKQYQVKYKYAN